jgi:hypothetical protein
MFLLRRFSLSLSIFFFSILYLGHNTLAETNELKSSALLSSSHRAPISRPVSWFPFHPDLPHAMAQLHPSKMGDYPGLISTTQSCIRQLKSLHRCRTCSVVCVCVCVCVCWNPHPSQFAYRLQLGRRALLVGSHAASEWSLSRLADFCIYRSPECGCTTLPRNRTDTDV